MIDATQVAAHTGALPDARGPPPFTPSGWQRGPGYHWHCVNTEFRQEILALQQLRTLGLCTWLPQEAPPGEALIRPLFPRYLFVQFDMADDAWREIYSRRGVVTIVGTGSGRPAALPDEALTTLWHQCAPNGVIYPAEDVLPVTRGVKRLGGTFERITSFSTSSRLAMLAHVLRGDVPPGARRFRHALAA